MRDEVPEVLCIWFGAGKRSGSSLWSRSDLNLPFSDDTKVLEHWLEPVLHGNEHHLSFGGGTIFVLAVIATGTALLGILIAAAVYLRGKGDSRVVEQPAAVREEVGHCHILRRPGVVQREAGGDVRHPTLPRHGAIG